MSNAEKISRILPEMDAIERTIRPFEPYSADVSEALKAIAEFKETASSPEKVDLNQVLEALNYAEGQLDQYRGKAFADQIIDGLTRHIDKIRKIIWEP